MKEKYEYTHNFGKAKGAGDIELELELRINDGKIVFSARGNVWNKRHTDAEMCGQCIDDIWEMYINDINDPSLYKEIMKLWKKWHLNDMHAECEHQEKRGERWATHPSAECPECRWKLGHGWSYRKIDDKDLKRICTIMEINPLDRLSIIRMNKTK